MSNIQKWTLPGYYRAPSGGSSAISSYGDVTVYIDFDSRKFQINLADGSTIKGSITTYLSGMAYQSYGMFGFVSNSGYFLFGNNDRFYPGYLAFGSSGDGTMVWAAKPTTVSGATFTPSSTGFDSKIVTPGETVPAICYLAGTLIMTPSGERAIETLQPGDQVIARRDGIERAETICWVGSARQAIDRNEIHDDCAGYPVRLRANALGDGLPHRDLFVTAEHCLHLDGYFVPARLLINAKTISYDKSEDSFDYFHIELEHHAIILANGVESESYLDTGNRLLFRQDTRETKAPAGQGRARSWLKDACAPLNVEPGFVKNLWDRFSPSPLAQATAARFTTTDPALHLKHPDGTRLAPYRRNGNTYVFRVDRPVGTYLLCSRHIRPCDEIGPYLDDRREFGVMVSSLTLWTSKGMNVFPLETYARTHEGWHPDEASGGKWTTGAAALTFDETLSDDQQSLILSVTVGETKTYRALPCEKPHSVAIVAAVP